MLLLAFLQLGWPLFYHLGLKTLEILQRARTCLPNSGALLWQLFLVTVKYIDCKFILLALSGLVIFLDSYLPFCLPVNVHLLLFEIFLICFTLLLLIHFLCTADEKIALLGAIQSLFEGSMYTFVFLWTPALSPNNEEIPHGFIFATFMLASMLGSSLASRLMARSSPKVESYMQIVFVVSSISLLLPIVTSVCYHLHLTFSLFFFCLIDIFCNYLKFH